MSEQGSNGEGGDVGPHEITWIGMQHLMHGYCGRTADAPKAAPAGSDGDDGSRAERPIAVVRRTRPRQARVVRIGPPRVGVDSPRAA